MQMLQKKDKIVNCTKYKNETKFMYGKFSDSGS